MRFYITQFEKGSFFMNNWNGFKCEEFDFKGRNAIAVLPENPNGSWLFKTEYFGAFPDLEIEMLKRGFAVLHVNNITRWNKHPEDTDIKAQFADFASKKYNLKKTCVPVGMSCGGMQAIYFAAKYPEYVSAMYLDAPVINLLSCPAGLGGKATDALYAEFQAATGMSISKLLSFRNHPLDHFEALVENDIPVFLVAGDSDGTVPFEENGALLDEYYKKHGGKIETVVKPGCDHHPHGLSDNTPIIEFILKYA